MEVSEFHIYVTSEITSTLWGGGGNLNLLMNHIHLTWHISYNFDTNCEIQTDRSIKISHLKTRL